jgi:hypothetical protein
MVQTLTEPLTEAAQTALRDDHRERDRVAWNVPRASVRTGPRKAYRDGLDWDGFRDLYYPDTRRHDLKAIVAYGAYKTLPRAGPQPASHPISTEALSLDEWEDEGGTAR